MTASTPTPLQVWSFPRAPLAPGRNPAPGTAAPVGGRSAACQLPQHPPSTIQLSSRKHKCCHFWQWSPYVKILEQPFSHSDTHIAADFALVRLAQTDMPSVPPWEAKKERWQLYPKFTLQATVWFHREWPSDLKKPQSRQKRSEPVSGYVKVLHNLQTLFWNTRIMLKFLSCLFFFLCRRNQRKWRRSSHWELKCFPCHKLFRLLPCPYARALQKLVRGDKTHNTLRDREIGKFEVNRHTATTNSNKVKALSVLYDQLFYKT